MFSKEEVYRIRLQAFSKTGSETPLFAAWPAGALRVPEAEQAVGLVARGGQGRIQQQLM